MEYKGKISLIGDENTGKTSLILRYIKDTFTEEYLTTLGADFVEYTYTSKNLSQLSVSDEFTIVFWDMAGQSHFKSIATIYCEGSSGMIIVFDINKRASFDGLPGWVDYARKTCLAADILIVGNKTDLEWAITKQEIEKMEKQVKAQILLASAKRALDDEESNVLNVFQTMAGAVFKKFKKKLET